MKNSLWMNFLERFEKNAGVKPQFTMGRFSMMPDFTAYMTKPASDLAPVFTFSLSLMASTVRGLSSTRSAISFVLFSSLEE
jgi:hypothetical protein